MSDYPIWIKVWATLAAIVFVPLIIASLYMLVVETWKMWQ